jgi:hypothetical protein
MLGKKILVGFIKHHHFRGKQEHGIIINLFMCIKPPAKAVLVKQQADCQEKSFHES